MTRPWTDSDLYALYDLSPEDVSYIERAIAPREPILSLDSPIPATHLPGGRKYRAGDVPDEAEAEGDE